MKLLNAYYYTAKILREGTNVWRQGTLNAADELDAIDRVYAMGKETWKRAVLEVNILGNGTGEVLATSTIGERVGPKLLPDYSKDSAVNDSHCVKKPAGMAPWQDDKQWWSVTEFGTHFDSGRFTILNQN